jgi:hypothetical protein
MLRGERALFLFSSLSGSHSFAFSVVASSKSSLHDFFQTLS